MIWVVVFFVGLVFVEYFNFIFLKDESQIWTPPSKQTTQPLKMASKMVENAWANMGYFLHLDPDIKITRLERLHLKIMKSKQCGF